MSCFYCMAGHMALPKEHVSVLHAIQVFIKEEDVRMCQMYLTEERRSSLKTVNAYTHATSPPLTLKT